MDRKVIPGSLEVPALARLAVPVMAPAGGSARSTVALLLADELAATSLDTVVLDCAPRLASPWPSWSTGKDAEAGTGAGAGGGLCVLAPDRPLTRAQVRGAAATRRAAGGGCRWQALTDGRAWHAAPLDLPAQPAAWYQLAAAGGWQAIVADTAHPVAHDVLAARCSGTAGLTRSWSELPFSVPVLCARATAEGVQGLQQAVMVLHAEGLPLHRTVVVLAAAADGRSPAVVRAAATMLSTHVADVVHLPHDPGIRANGLQAQPPRIRTRTRQAARQLAGAVLAAARHSFGDPLPDAPQPAPLPAAVVPAAVSTLPAAPAV